MDEMMRPASPEYTRPVHRRAAGGAWEVGAAVITQAELGRYAGLLGMQEEVGRKKERLRRGLIAQLEAGANVEPGRLRPSISRGMRREFNAKILETNFGRDWVNRTKAKLPAREVTSLRLLGRGERRRSSGRGRA